MNLKKSFAKILDTFGEENPQRCAHNYRNNLDKRQASKKMLQ